MTTPKTIEVPEELVRSMLEFLNGDMDLVEADELIERIEALLTKPQTFGE